MARNRFNINRLETTNSTGFNKYLVLTRNPVSAAFLAKAFPDILLSMVVV
jgi:hypothetical protein